MLLFYNMSNLKQLQNHKKKCYLDLATALSNSLYESKHTDANKDVNINNMPNFIKDERFAEHKIAKITNMITSSKNPTLKDAVSI